MIAIRFVLILAALFALKSVDRPVAAQTPPPGKASYDRVCRVCHGEDGKGDAGPRLVPFERDPEEVVAIVREGTGQMPPIAETRISDEEIRSIVAYLTALTDSKDVHK